MIKCHMTYNVWLHLILGKIVKLILMKNLQKIIKEDNNL